MPDRTDHLAPQVDLHQDRTITTRPAVLDQVVEVILAIDCLHPIRVAIDGVDAAGKTTLADELAVMIEGSGRRVIRASLDGFHNPRQTRYRLGPDSPEGYYQDSFNYQALLNDLLLPLGSGGDRIYRTTAFDYRIDAPIHVPWQTASPEAILLFDGIFLLRPILADHWDLSIFLQVDFEVSLSRALARDLAQGGDQQDAESLKVRYHQRYIPGQHLYFKDANPQERVDILIEYNDLENPILLFRRQTSS